MNHETTPYRQPGDPPPPPPIELASRLGGAALVMNALFVFVELALGGITPPPSVGQPSVLPGIIDIALGVALLRGNDKVRGWVLARIVIGAVIFGLLSASRRDWWMVASQLVVSLSLLGLIAGRAGRSRMIASLVGLTIYFATATLGLVAMRGGRNLIASTLASVSRDYVSPTPSEVLGVRGRYRLPVPAGWRVHTQANTHASNPLVDQWISDPSTDAHVMVVSETIRPDQFAQPGRLLQVMIDNARRGGTDYRELRRGTLEGRPAVPFADALLTSREGVGSPPLRLEYRFAAIGSGAQMIQVTGFYAASASDATRRSVRDAMTGIEPRAMEGLPGNEGGAAGEPHVVPVQGGVLRGRAYGYTLRVPVGWYLRNEAETRADNPRIDRWLVLPYENATLFVMVESPGAGMEYSPSLYLAEVRRMLSRESVAWRPDEPLRTQAGEGTMLRYEGTVEGVLQTWFVGIIVTPSAAYRITAMCASASLAAREASIRAMISSFSITSAAVPEVRP